MNLYRTSDMESALAVMTKRNHHVVGLADYRVKKMIKLRGRATQLVDTPMLYVMGWKPEADAVLQRWHKEGGALIYRPLPRVAPSHPACDALLLIEAPLQWESLQARIANVRQEAVFYRPPTWDLHEDALAHIWPHRHQFETMEAVLNSLVGRELTEQMERVRTLVPQWEKFALFTDVEMSAVTGWDTRMIRAILRRKYSMRYYRFPVFGIRYVATHHTVKWAYEVLIAQPTIGKKLHVLRNDNPFDGKRPSFVNAMRHLVRLNYVTREGSYFMVNMDRPPLRLDETEAVHNMHHGKWFRVKAFIDSLQEYPL